MEKRIYLNRRLSTKDESVFRKKAFTAILLSFGVVIVCLVRERMASKENVKEAFKKEEQTRPYQAIHIKKNITVLIEHSNATDQANTTTPFSLLNKNELYFSKCYPQMKEFELSMTCLLNQRKEEISFVSSYSPNEVVIVQGSHCSTGDRLLLSFHLIPIQSPKCIEIQGILKDNQPVNLYPIFVKLVSFLIKGNEVHLYEVKTAAIKPISLPPSKDNLYEAIDDILYHNTSLRLCLNETERSSFARMSNANKGIEMQWTSSDNHHLCFDRLFFVY